MHQIRKRDVKLLGPHGNWDWNPDLEIEMQEKSDLQTEVFLRLQLPSKMEPITGHNTVPQFSIMFKQRKQWTQVNPSKYNQIFIVHIRRKKKTKINNNNWGEARSRLVTSQLTRKLKSIYEINNRKKESYFSIFIILSELYWSDSLSCGCDKENPFRPFSNNLFSFFEIRKR